MKFLVASRDKYLMTAPQVPEEQEEFKAELLNFFTDFISLMAATSQDLIGAQILALKVCFSCYSAFLPFLLEFSRVVC